MSPLLFNNGWTDHNADCCINTIRGKMTMATNLINFGPVTPEILWCICMGGDCTKAKILCAVVFKNHSLGGSL